MALREEEQSQVERNASRADVEKQARASRIRGVGELRESENVFDAGAFAVGIAGRRSGVAREVGRWEKTISGLEQTSLGRSTQADRRRCQTSTHIADGGMPESEWTKVFGR